MFKTWVQVVKYTKLVQSCINSNVQRFSPLPTKFNFDFVFTLTKLLYYKILQNENFLEHKTHKSTAYMTYSSIYHICIQLDLKRKKYVL